LKRAGTSSCRAIAVSLLCAVVAGCSGGSNGGGPQGSGGSSGGTGGASGNGGSGGGGGAGGADASGTGGAGADAGSGGAPIILSLATNVTTLTPNGSLIVTAVVTHPQGIAQVIGGTLNDPGGASYGAFGVSTTSGSYSISLSWSAIEAVQDINAASGGVSRMFEATFYDQAGHSTSQTFTIQLQCPTSTDAICSGVCNSLHADTTSCGGCGRDCRTVFPSLSSPTCSTQAKCGGSLTSTVLQSCTAACQAVSLTCTGSVTASYRSGTSSASMTTDCATVPPATLSSLPFDSLFCKCTE
jgi:hypothetical protein